MTDEVRSARRQSRDFRSIDAVSGESVGEALDEIYTFDKPTLFLRGEKSNYIKDADIHQIEKHFPKSSVVTIEGAGHWINAEKPQLFYETVTGFLTK